MDYSARHVLVCTRYGIGDTTMELPCLGALRAQLPRAHITALGASPATQLLEGHPAIDAIARLGRFSIDHRWHDGGAGTRQVLREWLQANAFDVALNLYHAPAAVGEAVWELEIPSFESDPAAEGAAIARGEGGIAAIKAGARAGWGIAVPDDTRPDLALRRHERAEADRCLGLCAGNITCPVAMSVVASQELKRWPLDRMARIAEVLIEDHGGPLLLFCGPQLEAGARMRRVMRHGAEVVVIGGIPLRRVAALLNRCRCFVSNDTGLMHIAAAVGTPTVGIFGPTTPAMYAPRVPWVRTVGNDHAFCPYRETRALNPPACFGGARCLVSDRGCIEDVTEDEVLAQVRELLSEVADRRPLATRAESGRCTP